MADRLLIIKEGQLEQIGPPQTCYLEPATPWVAGLLGAINRTTSVQDINNDRVYSVGPQIVQALNPFPDVRFPVGQRVELRSRPEDIELYEQEPELPPHYSVNRPIVLTPASKANIGGLHCAMNQTSCTMHSMRNT